MKKESFVCGDNFLEGEDSSLGNYQQELNMALVKIKKLEQENSDWKDLLSKLKNFDEWKRWKIGDG